MRKILFAIALTMASIPAFGQALTTTDLSSTLGTSATQCVSPNAARKTLSMENPAANTYDIGYCVGATCVPSIGSQGTSVLIPGAIDFWPNGSAPTGPVNCIAAGASTPITVRSGQ